MKPDRKSSAPSDPAAQESIEHGELGAGGRTAKDKPDPSDPHNEGGADPLKHLIETADAVRRGKSDPM